MGALTSPPVPEVGKSHPWILTAIFEGWAYLTIKPELWRPCNWA
jgi:hypothetical protein